MSTSIGSTVSPTFCRIPSNTVAQGNAIIVSHPIQSLGSHLQLGHGHGCRPSTSTPGPSPCVSLHLEPFVIAPASQL